MAHARPSMPLRMTGIALAAVTTLAVAGCGDDTEDIPNPEAPGESASPTPGADGAAALADAMVEAGRTAEGEVEGSRVVSLEADDGEWEVTVVDADGVEHELRISADGSEVTRGAEKDDTDERDREENLAELEAAQLDHEQALEAVAAEADDQRVTDLQLDERGDIVVWEAELEDGTDIRIDAGSGDVID